MSPTGTACTDDGLECTDDFCTGAGSCVHSNKSAGTNCSSDSNGCTDDVCDGSGACTHPGNSLPCNDNVYCNGTDTCGGGSCSIHTGNPCVGPDGDNNCKESCNEGGDNCLANDPNGSFCNNSASCDGADSCSNGTCTGSGICCGTRNFQFNIGSNNGGSFDPAEWPNGNVSQSSQGGCSVTIDRPGGNLDTTEVGGDSFNIVTFSGFSGCSATGGACNSCPPAGICRYVNHRPSCSAALNGSGSARFNVRCTDH